MRSRDVGEGRRQRGQIDLDELARRVLKAPGRPAQAPPTGSPVEHQEAQRQLRNALISQQPGKSLGIATLHGGVAYHAGTTVPRVGLTFGTHRSGIDVPAELARPPAPADLLGVYITWGEVIGPELDPRLLLATLPSRDLLTTLSTLGLLLHNVENGPASPDRDREIASLLKVPYRGRAENLVNAGHVLVSAQGILGLAKLAIELCAAKPSDDSNDQRWLLLGILATQGLYGRGEAEADTSAELDGIRGSARAAIDLIRAQLFLSRSDPVTLLAHSQLRWREIPNRFRMHKHFIDLEKAFFETTGVLLDDFVAVALALWTLVLQGNAGAVLDDGLGLKLPRRRVAAALKLFCASPTTLRRELRVTSGLKDFAWSFDALRRYPVVRVDRTKLVLLSPRLLIERVFSLVRWDIEHTLRSASKTKEADQVRQFWQFVCEQDARESLESIAPSTGLAKRLYSENDLRAAYATRRHTPKLADFAIDYPTAWVVGDITSSTLRRDINVGDGRVALEGGLDKVLAKARQVESTIDLIRSNETRLTAARTRYQRHFVPLIVMAEGFPVNPITTALLRDRLKRASILQQPDIARLHLIDNEELSMLEAFASQGHSMLQLLLDHEGASLERMALRDYLLVERGFDPKSRPDRLNGPFNRAWRPVFNALGAAAEREYCR